MVVVKTRIISIFFTEETEQSGRYEARALKINESSEDIEMPIKKCRRAHMNHFSGKKLTLIEQCYDLHIIIPLFIFNNSKQPLLIPFNVHISFHCLHQ